MEGNKAINQSATVCVANHVKQALISRGWTALINNECRQKRHHSGVVLLCITTGNLVLQSLNHWSRSFWGPTHLKASMLITLVWREHNIWMKYCMLFTTAHMWTNVWSIRAQFYRTIIDVCWYLNNPDFKKMWNFTCVNISIQSVYQQQYSLYISIIKW